jgi:hypothetical protein
MLKVTVWWVDICGETAWTDPADLTGPKWIITRGWLVREAEDWVAVAASIPVDSDDHEVGSIEQIPTNCLRLIEVE